jgi:hypothetical protein
LAPANAADLNVGVELLSAHTDLTVLGDKAYISAAAAAELWQQQRIRLLSPPRRNQKEQLPPEVVRLFTKLTAHTLCIYLNHLLGNPDWLQVKALAFPI